jgi:hypothetical protein
LLSPEPKACMHHLIIAYFFPMGDHSLLESQENTKLTPWSRAAPTSTPNDSKSVVAFTKLIKMEIFRGQIRNYRWGMWRSGFHCVSDSRKSMESLQSRLFSVSSTRLSGRELFICKQTHSCQRLSIFFQWKYRTETYQGVGTWQVALARAEF